VRLSAASSSAACYLAAGGRLAKWRNQWLVMAAAIDWLVAA